MKKIVFSFIMSMLCTSMMANTDTLQVFMEGADLKIEVGDIQELREIQQHDLNEIISDIVETAEEAEDSVATMKSFEFEWELNNKKAKPSDLGDGTYVGTIVDTMETDDSYLMLMYGYPKVSKKKRSMNFTEIRLGLNNFLEDGSFPSGNSNYALGTLSSRSFSIAFNTQTRIFKERSPLYIKYGIDFNFNNYRLQNNVRIVEGDNNIEFVKDEVNNYCKSKLATIYFDVPVMFLLDFENKRTKRRDFMIGLGAYAGYRLRSITKHKFTDANGNDHKGKDKGSFYLNNFRYGVHGQIGFRSLTFFARYQLNELFENQAGNPNLNLVDFGIILALFRS